MIQVICRHILRNLALLPAFVMVLALSACSMMTEDGPQDPAEEQGLFLVCNVGMVGQTRAGESPAIESMKTLRIVVLDDKGAVESNEYFSFEALREQYRHVTELKSRTKKRVYIFSNEESVTDMKSEPASAGLSGSLHDFLQNVKEGATDFETKIASIYYQPDFTQAIPLNAVYDVEIPDGVRFIEKSFWLVRVATKFSFTFINSRYEDLTIERFEVRGLSDSHFFMPRFTDNKVPSFPGFATWIDWLKDVSDKTQTDPDSPSADESGWLTGYDIPAAAKTQVLSYASPFTLAKVKEIGEQGGMKEISNFYACESKSLRTDGGSVVEKEQQYFIHVECSSNGQRRTFDRALPNLRALFRNTHVNVIVTISDKDLALVVDLQPFSCVTLRPDLGLERTEDGYIVVRDKDGHIVKYIRPDGTELYFQEDNRWPYLGTFMGVFDEYKRVLTGYFADGRSIIFNYTSDELNPDDVYENLDSWGIYSRPDLTDRNGNVIPEHLEETYCFNNYENDGVDGGYIKYAHTHTMLDQKGRVIEEYKYDSLDAFREHKAHEKNQEGEHENCSRIKLAEYTGYRYGDKIITYYDHSGERTAVLTVRGDTETLKSYK